MTQASFWQQHSHPTDFADLCNGLYEREIRLLSHASNVTVQGIQARLQSLPYYINRTAHLMMHVVISGQSPLQLDAQNATWFAKQAKEMPLSGQDLSSIIHWYNTGEATVGLVVPVQSDNAIILDCIDRIDVDSKRIRTNIAGWFFLGEQENRVLSSTNTRFNLLKPNKKVMLAACSGHCWQKNNKARPIIPSLRELLLSCGINWQNFKKPKLLTVL